MIKKFPIPATNQSLAEIDFQRFSQAFSEILVRKIVAAEKVNFIFNREQLHSVFSAKKNYKELLDFYKSIQQKRKHFGVVDCFLFFAFKVNTEKTIVAVISNLDPLFSKRVREDWLSDTLYEIEREFLLLKQARVDEQTGFFNLANLRSLLDSARGVKQVQLILVEIPGKRSSFQSANRHLYNCCSTIQDYFPQVTVIHYLGNCVFAIVLELPGGRLHKKDTKLASGMVSYLKIAGFKKIRASVNRYDPFKSELHETSDLSVRLLDEAWTALDVAAKRGPFGFCDYSLLSQPELHPLYPPDNKLVRKFSRLWCNAQTFSIICFRSDNPEISAASLVLPHLDKGESFEHGKEFFVYSEETGDQALRWSQMMVAKCEGINAEKTVSAGVGSFPFSDFKKSEILYNCHKALMHASFLGKAGAVLFDAVSLNISGDIFFEDGNLIKAVKEYERGLRCDENDVNLYNSLGVAYTMMNKFASSMSCFSKAIVLEKNNFMALYNLGLGALHNQEKMLALNYFQKALSSYSGEDFGVKSDLEKQIGILASEVGDYALALEHLMSWYESSEAKQTAGSVLFYIGQSWHGLKEDKKAMEWLQRALRVNEYDARAMNLLGRVYFEGGEGDDIALSLCQKSVELDPENESHRLQLAKVQIDCDMVDEARSNLKQCLKNKKCKVEAQLCLAQCYNLIGHYKRAVNWFYKVDPGELTNLLLYSNLKKSLAKHLNN